MTIWGWDASHFDGLLSRAILARAKSEGITFFTHKIAEGLSDTEGRIDDTALAAARAAGIEFLGGYLIPRSNAGVSAQVDRWIALADQGEPWWHTFPGWFWQIDLERWPYDAVPASTGILAARELRERTGRLVVLYASRGQYGNTLGGWDGPLWNADYVSNRPGSPAQLYPGDGWAPGWAPYSGKTPTILQFTSSATIAGLTTCDANAYPGTVNELRALITGTTTKGTTVATDMTRAEVLGGDLSSGDNVLHARLRLAEDSSDALAAAQPFAKDIPKVPGRKQLGEKLDAIALDAHAAANRPITVTMTVEDLAAIVAGMKAEVASLIPTPEQIAAAVLDEQHRRDAA